MMFIKAMQIHSGKVAGSWPESIYFPL